MVLIRLTDYVGFAVKTHLPCKNMMTENTRLKVAALLKKLERFSSKPYWDVKGWSVGYGHFIGNNKAAYANGITEQQAHAILMNDIAQFEAQIPNYFSVSLNDRQTAALVLWAFNFGANRFKEATFAKKINAGVKDRADISKGNGTNGWESWNKVNGAYHKGIHQRRIMECAIFFGDTKIPIPDYAGGGTMDWAEGATNQNNLLPNMPTIPSATKILPYAMIALGVLTLGGALIYFSKD